MTWPLTKIKFLLFTIPLDAIIVVLLISVLLEDKFFKLFPASYKKMFSNSLLYFFPTIKVKPLNESLNCCALTVGKKNLNFHN